MKSFLKIYKDYIEVSSILRRCGTTYEKARFNRGNYRSKKNWK